MNDLNAIHFSRPVGISDKTADSALKRLTGTIPMINTQMINTDLSKPSQNPDTKDLT